MLVFRALFAGGAVAATVAVGEGNTLQTEVEVNAHGTVQNGQQRAEQVATHTQSKWRHENWPDPNVLDDNWLSAFPAKHFDSTLAVGAGNTPSEKFLAKYGIKKKNGVAFVLWGFFHDEARLSPNRKNALAILRTGQIGVPFLLLNGTTILDAEVPTDPFPEAVHQTLRTKEGLAPNHLGDFFKVYLWHHHGGGWIDIKPSVSNVAKNWDVFQHDNIWASVPSFTPMGVACHIPYF